MSKILIEFDIENDAFHVDLPREVRRIFNYIASELGTLGDHDELRLRDSNGNTIGTAKVDHYVGRSI